MKIKDVILISEAKKISESQGKMRFKFLGLLKACQSRTAKNGSEFLVLEFKDKSGSISMNCFDGAAGFEFFKSSNIGDAFYITASSEFYQGRLSPRLEDVEELEDVSEVLPYLVETSRYDPQDMTSELFSIIEKISDEKLRQTVKYALAEAGEDFYKSTAAVKMHHAYMYGLLEHSLSCARTCAALLPFYSFVNADLALAGSILHDIGKVDEYSQDLVSDRTRTGILQGHVVLGYRRVRKAGLKNGLNPDLQERLEHIILSHQGELEWGAAVRASTPEAVFVSNVDYFDARMGAVEMVINSAGAAEFVESPALRAKILTSKISESSALDEGED